MCGDRDHMIQLESGTVGHLIRAACASCATSSNGGIVATLKNTLIKQKNRVFGKYSKLSPPSNIMHRKSQSHIRDKDPVPNASGFTGF